MAFSVPVDLDLIAQRHSVRSYKNESLTRDEVSQMEEALSELPKGPFGGEVRLTMLDAKALQLKGERLGTYGVINEAPYYLAGAVSWGTKPLADYGYVMEHAILAATKLGLGSCWLGGTFSKSAFKQAVGLKSGEFLPAVSPLGHEAPKKRLVDKILCFVSRSKSRHPFESMFYNAMGDPLTEQAAGEWAKPLQAVRLAPSASNGQPWRIKMTEDGFHFALAHTGSFQEIDLGIAMAHFELVAQSLQLNGHWQTTDLPETTLALWKL